MHHLLPLSRPPVKYSDEILKVNVYCTQILGLKFLFLWVIFLLALSEI